MFRLSCYIGFIVAICVCTLQRADASLDLKLPDELKSAVVYAPPPIPPLSFRENHVGGSGVYRLRLRPNGTVVSVNVIKSTGFPQLDQSCIDAFQAWRFRPVFAQHHPVGEIPVIFALNRFAYQRTRFP